MNSLLRRFRARHEDKVQICGDCGRDVRVIRSCYMLLRGLWEQYGNGDGLLCMDCLEQRMGRQVVLDDFADTLVNAIYLAFHRERHLSQGPRVDFETLENQRGRLLIDKDGVTRWIDFNASALKKEGSYLKVKEQGLETWFPLSSIRKIVLESSLSGEAS